METSEKDNTPSRNRPLYSQEDVYTITAVKVREALRMERERQRRAEHYIAVGLVGITP